MNFLYHNAHHNIKKLSVLLSFFCFLERINQLEVHYMLFIVEMCLKRPHIMLFIIEKGIRRPHIVLCNVEKGIRRPHIVLFIVETGLKLTYCNLYYKNKLQIDIARHYSANAPSKFSFNLAKNCSVVRKSLSNISLPYTNKAKSLVI